MHTPDDAHVALYRRYRPRRLAELVGQNHVVATLTGALRSGRVSHAYLLAGPRGCGKTTVARVLAMALNCTGDDTIEPCGTCESCRSITAGSSMDVIELDAASHNGVDSMRDLVSKAALGSQGRRKVYIIDEVHMLSTAASNALLKTLEEAPAHVVFALATTDPQNLLATVRSRCQRLDFRLVAPQVLAGRLRAVADAEGLEVTDGQIAEAVRRGAGSVRDALSALDALAASGDIHVDDVAGGIVDAAMAGDRAGLLVAVAEAVTAGNDPRAVTEDALALLRDMFLVQQGAGQLAGTVDLDSLEARARAAGSRRTVALADALGEAVIQMRAGFDPRISLEVHLARWCANEQRRAHAAA